jgi:transcriptional regulator with XRE-family HTH domain
MSDALRNVPLTPSLTSSGDSLDDACREDEGQRPSSQVSAAMEQRLAGIIGASVRAARQRLDLTQADVAERVGIATEVYGRLERGHMLPSVKTLRRLCLVLHCSSDVLLGVASAEKPIVVAEDPPEYGERPEVRRVLRSLRRLEPAQLRLISQVAGAIHR